MNPINYPTLTLRDGTTYKLRMGLKSMKKLEEWGVKLQITPENVAQSWDQLRAQVAAGAYTNGDGPLTYANLTPEQLETMYEGDPDLAEMAAMRVAVNKAITFRMPSDVVNSLSETAATIGS